MDDESSQSADELERARRLHKSLVRRFANLSESVTGYWQKCRSEIFELAEVAKYRNRELRRKLIGAYISTAALLAALLVGLAGTLAESNANKRLRDGVRAHLRELQAAGHAEFDAASGALVWLPDRTPIAVAGEVGLGQRPPQATPAAATPTPPTAVTEEGE